MLLFNFTEQKLNKMEELRNKIMMETGLNAGQADHVLAIVSAYMKERTPPIIHNRLDQILSGKKLEDSFRDDLDAFGKTVRERADELAGDLKTAFDKAFKGRKE
jgi:hypothetical protein